MIIIDILLVIFFVLMNAFFVTAEFALVKVRKSQIDILAAGGRRGAKYAQIAVKDLNLYLSACQLGITLASLALGWIGEPAVSAIIGPVLSWIGLGSATIHTISIVVGFLAITMLHIVIGELVPKSLAILNAEKFATATAMPLVYFYRLTYPIMWLFNTATNGLLKLMGYSAVSDGHENAHSDEELQMLVEDSYKHGLIDKTEYTYVDNIFEATDKVVRDVMMPRPDMVCLFKGDGADKMIETAIREKYTRYPVCEGSRDNVVGFINIRDVYEKRIQGNPFTVEGLIRPIIIVPDSMPINDLLKKFQKEKENIAVVIDEYGGTAGLVTMEDILEEIVGSLCDEYDEEEKEIEPLDDHTFLVKGLVDLDKVCDITGVCLPSDEYDTLNGFLIAKLGRIPTVKERPVIQHEGVEFAIEKMAKNRILSVRITKLPPALETAGETASGA
ncbi:hemolysin family protein [Methanomassiliicoccus luminyensis]|jgi:CBS domain containing-hemolysin-like protein|uniref:hemolysin family protein n=1 Tax=Methanomassiliicoccus luminyensis TaxID=1080712 RepID=UPI00037001C9|nr:hemolysin family protein [Methanomassiliicoccus luminyensis]